ncbi:MAG TPA: aspartate aminotransferase family protein [Solirubrobacteraceae bacterium]|nr:aspartate aminotransferase family protein [Solirubrobacteraceae bacterium]
MSMVPTHAELAAWDLDHMIHPWSFPGSSLMIVRGQGSSYWDAEGREYLDALGGIQLCEIGHGRRELGEVAAAQIGELEYSPLFWNFGNEPSARLARRLVDLAPAGIDHVFFTNGGSESCESAIKMARLYHYLRGEADRTMILSLGHSYHGMTYGALAATGLEGVKNGFGELPGGFFHLTTPYPYRDELFGGEDPFEFCVSELERTISQLGPGRIAAFIGEPVLTVGGVIVPPREYWEAVTEICHRHGILVISDEVVTAFGRLGSWFASPSWGIEPDLITTAKGLTSGYLPLGAVLASHEVGGTIKDAETGFMHGYTYCGHPVACEVAMRNLDIIEREDLASNATTVGARLLSSLQGLLELPVVGDVRGAGLLASVELVADKTTKQPIEVRRQEIADRVRDEQGVIVRSIYQNVIIAPCLILTVDEADRIAQALHAVLQTTGLDGRPTSAASALRA